jgi:hypothetical protein
MEATMTSFLAEEAAANLSTEEVFGDDLIVIYSDVPI